VNKENQVRTPSAALRSDSQLTIKHVILFDIDGTLVSSVRSEHDERQRYVLAVRDVTGKLVNVNPSRFAGMVDPQICRVILSENGLSAQALDLLPRIIERMGEIYRVMKKDVSLNVGVIDLLHVLEASQTNVLGVITGNVASVGEEKLSVAGVKSYLTEKFYADHYFNRPSLARNAVEVCLSKYGLRDSKSVRVVGDTPLDIEAANSAGAKSIGIASGVYSTGFLSKAGADAVFPDLTPSKDLLTALESDTCI
jgi:phosphoglycolate phosphatase-like HAD superfamily hydrolase